MKFTKLSLIAAVAVSAITTTAIAEVELSANVAATNNYVWRGMTQNSNSAAIQGGFDAAIGGVYIGTWLSNVDAPSTAEVDGYVGYAGEVGSLGYDIGFIRYGYIDNASANFNETYLGLSYDFGAVSVGAMYSRGLDTAPDDIGVDVSIPVMQDYSLDLAAGEYDTYGKRYSVGLSKSFDKIDYSIAYSSFSADTTTGNAGAADQSHVIVSAGTSF